MRVAITEIRWIEVKKPARERIAKADADGLCVACLQSLNGEKPIRGCHSKCYRATMRAIEQGKCTDEERVASGKLLECGKSGRKPSNPVTQDVG